MERAFFDQLTAFSFRFFDMELEEARSNVFNPDRWQTPNFHIVGSYAANVLGCGHEHAPPPNNLRKKG